MRKRHSLPVFFLISPASYSNSSRSGSWSRNRKSIQIQNGIERKGTSTQDKILIIDLNPHISSMIQLRASLRGKMTNIHIYEHKCMTYYQLVIDGNKKDIYSRARLNRKQTERKLKKTEISTASRLDWY